MLLTTHDTMNKTRRIPCKGRVSRKKEASAPDGFLFRLLCSGLHTTTPPTTKLLVRMLQYYSLDFLFHQTEAKKIAQCLNLKIFLFLKSYVKLILGTFRVSKSGYLTISDDVNYDFFKVNFSFEKMQKKLPETKF